MNELYNKMFVFSLLSYGGLEVFLHACFPTLKIVPATFWQIANNNMTDSSCLQVLFD